MDQPLRVICAACHATFRVKRIVPGRMPACAKCGGALTLPSQARLVCDACHKTTKPAAIDLARQVACPGCKKALRVHSMAPPAAGGGSQPAGQVRVDDVTVRMEPSQQAEARVDTEGLTVQFAGGGESAPGSQTPKPSGVKEDSLALQPLDGESEGLRKARFGKYEILSEIARGGMGIVYKAYDPRLRRHVALKVLLAGEGATEESIRRFLLEARAAGQLRHTHVVSVHEVGEHQGQFYYVMDLVEGRDIGEIMDAGEVKIKAMLRHVRDVCLALQAAHDNGIIHRDLKPQNIMIDKDDQALIMDFGLAKDLTSESIQSMTGSVFGTPAYMSPEQAQGRTHEIDHRSDVYSMGVILYELCTGEKPFGGNTVFDTIQAVVSDEPRAPRELSPRLNADLNTIILKCMEKAPERRYPSMRDLAEDLQRYLDGEPIAARPVSAPARLWRRVRKNTPALIACVAIPAVLVVGLVVYLLFAGDFLSDMQAEVASGKPQRMVSALTVLSARLKDGTIEGDDRGRALAIARQALGGKSIEAEDLALRILAQARDGAAGGVLLALARSSDLAARRRVQAMETLAAIGPDKLHEATQVVAALCALLQAKSGSAELRIGAARALGSFYGKQARHVLVPVAVDTAEPESVRVAAIRALGANVSLQSAAMRTLLELQGDESPAVVRAAEMALAKARHRTAIYDLYGIKGNVANALEAVGQVQQLDAQRNRQMMDLLDDPTGSQRQHKRKKPVALVLAKLESPDAAVRMAAAYDLGAMGEREAIGYLLAHLTDSDNGVRRSAACALLKLAAKHPNAIDVTQVIALLAHSDPLVRENAAVLLGGLEASSAAAPLCQSLAKETSGRTTRAMVRALAQINEPAGLTAISKTLDRVMADKDTALVCIQALVAFKDAAVPHLVRALSATSPKLRDAAARALREATGEDFGQDKAKWDAWLKRQAP